MEAVLEARIHQKVTLNHDVHSFVRWKIKKYTIIEGSMRRSRERSKGDDVQEEDRKIKWFVYQEMEMKESKVCNRTAARGQHDIENPPSNSSSQSERTYFLYRALTH